VKTSRAAKLLLGYWMRGARISMGRVKG